MMRDYDPNNDRNGYWSGEYVLYTEAVQQIEALEHMLEALLDAHYGASLHHIGDGDGISVGEAEQLREWRGERLASSRAALQSAKEGQA